MALFDMMSVKAFSEKAGIDHDTVRRLCKEGKLPCYIVGKSKKKISFRLPWEEAIEAFKALMIAPKEEVKTETGTEIVVKAKTYKPKRIRVAASGEFDFKREMERLRDL